LVEFDSGLPLLLLLEEELCDDADWPSPNVTPRTTAKIIPTDNDASTKIMKLGRRYHGDAWDDPEIGLVEESFSAMANALVFGSVFVFVVIVFCPVVVSRQISFGDTHP
jgi:hypothetical protein